MIAYTNLQQMNFEALCEYAPEGHSASSLVLFLFNSLGLKLI